MPWRCPACHDQIKHNELEDHPRLGVTYRCHICRLELAVDRETGKLMAVPVVDDEPNDRMRKTS